MNTLTVITAADDVIEVKTKNLLSTFYVLQKLAVQDTYAATTFPIYTKRGNKFYKVKPTLKYAGLNFYERMDAKKFGVEADFYTGLAENVYIKHNNNTYIQIPLFFVLTANKFSTTDFAITAGVEEILENGKKIEFGNGTNTNTRFIADLKLQAEVENDEVQYRQAIVELFYFIKNAANEFAKEITEIKKVNAEQYIKIKDTLKDYMLNPQKYAQEETKESLEL